MSTKRTANSPPSGTEPTTKAAKTSGVQSIYAQTPAELHNHKGEQMRKRFESRRVGPASEVDKREKAARLWELEKEKLDKEFKKAITREGVKTLTETHHTDPVLEGNAGSATSSSQTKKIIDACGTNKKSSQPFLKQNQANKESHKNSAPVRQKVKSEGEVTTPRQPGSRKKSLPKSPDGTIDTYRKGNIRPSAIESTSASSAGKYHTSSSHLSHLDFLTTSLINLLDPYTRLHSSCFAVRPLQIIHTSLSSSPLIATTLFTALKDAQELLKVLASHQTTTLQKLETMRGECQQVGMESVVAEAERKVKETEGHVSKLEEWIGECGCLGSGV